MKICILGLDGATPEVIFQDERLANLRRLMDLGLYGRLNSASPSAWMQMCTSQQSLSSEAPAMWDCLEKAGKKPIVIGPFLDPAKSKLAHPPEINARLTELMGDGPHDIRGNQQIVEMSGKQWDLMRQLIAGEAWDYFHFVDIGLDHVQGADATSDYYLWLDEQVATIFELIDDQTIVLVTSVGNQRTDPPGGFFILAAPNCPLSGEYENAGILDIAPTLFDLAGYEIPATMQGKSMVAGMEKKGAGKDSSPSDAEKLIHDRLSGLGYV